MPLIKRYKLPEHEYDIMDFMVHPDTRMSVDEKLWGLDIADKPIPQLGDLCLVWDNCKFYKAKVSRVDLEKKTYAADYLEIPIRNSNIHFARFRPIS